MYAYVLLMRSVRPPAPLVIQMSDKLLMVSQDSFVGIKPVLQQLSAYTLYIELFFYYACNTAKPLYRFRMAAHLIVHILIAQG